MYIPDIDVDQAIKSRNVGGWGALSCQKQRRRNNSNQNKTNGKGTFYLTPTQKTGGKAKHEKTQQQQTKKRSREI